MQKKNKTKLPLPLAITRLVAVILLPSLLLYFAHLILFFTLEPSSLSFAPGANLASTIAREEALYRLIEVSPGSSYSIFIDNGVSLTYYRITDVSYRYGLVMHDFFTSFSFGLTLGLQEARSIVFDSLLLDITSILLGGAIGFILSFLYWLGLPSLKRYGRYLYLFPGIALIGMMVAMFAFKEPSATIALSIFFFISLALTFFRNTITHKRLLGFFPSGVGFIFLPLLFVDIFRGEGFGFVLGQAYISNDIRLFIALMMTYLGFIIIPLGISAILLFALHFQKGIIYGRQKEDR